MTTDGSLDLRELSEHLELLRDQAKRVERSARIVKRQAAQAAEAVTAAIDEQSQEDTSNGEED
jgi:hypothetical protein